MRQHREAAEGGRLELLERDPVGDDVLGAVGRHRERIAEQVHPVARMAQSGEGLMRRARIALCAWCGAQIGVPNCGPDGAGPRDVSSQGLSAGVALVNLAADPPD